MIRAGEGAAQEHAGGPEQGEAAGADAGDGEGAPGVAAAQAVGEAGDDGVEEARDGRLAALERPLGLGRHVACFAQEAAAFDHGHQQQDARAPHHVPVVGDAQRPVDVEGAGPAGQRLRGRVVGVGWLRGGARPCLRLKVELLAEADGVV